MRPLFKVVYTIIGILLSIFIVVKVVNSLKSTKPPPIPNDATTELEKYTAQLKGLQTQMKADVDGADTPSPICIINDDPKTGYLYQKQQIQNVFDKVTRDNLVATADPKAVNAYNDISSSINAFTDKVDKLLPCSQYCYQGTLDNSSLACVCNEQYPVPIIYKDSNGQDRVYCWLDDCELRPHRQFIPGSSRDPSTNNCKCMTGFVEKDGNCVDQAVDQQLMELTTKINKNTKILDFFFCKLNDGDSDIIVTDLGNLEKAASALITANPGNIISQDTLNKYSTAKTAADDAITKYNGFQKCEDYCGNTAKYDEISNACLCNDNDPNIIFDKVKGCTCKSGYEPGLNACVPIQNPDTENLISSTAFILQFTNEILKKCTNCTTAKTFNDKVTYINQLQTSCNQSIKTGIPSKASVDAYNVQVTKTENIIQTIMYKKLPDCGDYCWQATYNETNNDCECPTGTTKAVNSSDGKTYTYCYICGQNSNFVFPNPPTKEPSPSTNCVCDTNFGICNTPNLCEDCTAKLVNDNTSLNTDYDNIQATVTNNFDTYGRLLVAGKIPVIIKSRSNIGSKPLSKKVITANALLECAKNLETVSAFSFLPGSLSDNCILYTTGNQKNTVPDETSIYGFTM